MPVIQQIAIECLLCAMYSRGEGQTSKIIPLINV